MKKNSAITVAPNVARITESLRDTGYDLNMAIADLTDNAIAANATLVDVRVGLKADGAPVVAVGDNGHGMDEDALINCMRYGSDAQTTISRLGKFGMGLKTASTAFCRRLVVVSRRRARGKALHAAWDLDHLASTGEWHMELGRPAPEALDYLNLCTQKGPGTAVIWEKIDRLLCTEVEPTAQGLAPTHSTPQERVERIVKSLRGHLALVFQRYLDPACEETRTVRVILNGDIVPPWNPFATDYAQAAGTHILTASQDGVMTPIVVSASLLPRPETLPDEAARAAAQIVTHRQGLYVYRENRLIHGPDWLGIQPQDPVWTLLRVSLSFDARLDSAFMVDIKKSRVLINEHLYGWLKNTFLPPLLHRAEERWRQGAAENGRKNAQTRHAVSDSVIGQQLDGLRKADLLELHPQRQEALVRNNNGTVLARMAIMTEEAPLLRHIHPCTDMDESTLWEAAVINGSPAVRLNVGHPFYSRIYLPNEQNSPVVQGLDALFWTLAQAEVNNVTTDSRDLFAAMRAEVTRNLTTLLRNLPE